MSDSDSYTGYISKMIDCVVKNTTKTKFANFKYLCENAIFENNKFTGNTSLKFFLAGRFVNCKILNNYFYKGIRSVYFDIETGNSENKSLNTLIKNNIIRDFTNMLTIGLHSGCSVEENIFKGTCTTVFEGAWNSCNILRNKKDELTYTNLKTNLNNHIYDDLSSGEDYISYIADQSTRTRYYLSYENGTIKAKTV